MTSFKPKYVPPASVPFCLVWSKAEKDFLRGDPFFNQDLTTRIGPIFTPSFDLFETMDKYLLLGDLPGLGMADLDLELTATSLTITGEREGEVVDAGASCHALERTFGSFVRKFEFPEGVDGARSLARMRDGVLLVELPKRLEGLPRC
jgi:HSP20 family protein